MERAVIYSPLWRVMREIEETAERSEFLHV